MTSSKNLQIDKCIWINLDHRVDRKEHMEDLLKECEWSHERLSATRLEGDLSLHNIEMIKRLEGKNGVASIWISHKRALETILNGGVSHSAVILEDDLRLPEPQRFWAANDKLQLPNGLDDNWEILFLSPKYRYKNKDIAQKNGCETYFAPPPSEEMAVKFSEYQDIFIITGAHFVVFKNSEVIESVIKKMNETQYLFDVDEFYVKTFNTYGYSTASVTHGGFGSDHN